MLVTRSQSSKGHIKFHIQILDTFKGMISIQYVLCVCMFIKMCFHLNICFCVSSKAICLCKVIYGSYVTFVSLKGNTFFSFFLFVLSLVIKFPQITMVLTFALTQLFVLAFVSLLFPSVSLYCLPVLFLLTISLHTYSSMHLKKLCQRCSRI